MKLKTLQSFSQRDSLWANILLGYNTDKQFSIGQYGCLITSFANYIGKTPLEVNQILKDNGGFTAGGGNFVWGKCSVLGLKEVYRSPYYSDPVTSQGITKMKELLSEGRPLICHVDFDPRDPDDDQHWILVYGYDDPEIFFAVDSWSETFITLDVYGGVRRAVLEWRCYDKILEKELDIPTVVIGVSELDEYKRRALIAEHTAQKIGVGLNEAIIMPELDKLIAYEDIVVEKDRLLTEAQEKINKLEKQVDDKAGELEKLTKKLSDLTGEVQKATNDNKILSGELKTLKVQCNQPVLSGWKKWLYETLLKG